MVVADDWIAEWLSACYICTLGKIKRNTSQTEEDDTATLLMMSITLERLH